MIHRQRDYRDALPWRLAFSLDPRRFPRLGLGLLNIFIFFSKVALLLFFFIWCAGPCRVSAMTN